MQTLSDFYQSIFGCKTYKISLDAGCTCPNRDGSKGTGGCVFCSENGSGDFVAARALSVREKLEQGRALVEAKLRGRSGERKGKYIAYFQNFTSTYGNVKALLEKYRQALECENVAGIAVATRPDCLGDEILRGLADISREHFVQMELGLQTCNETTGRFINRCYTNQDYIDAVRRIREAAPNIHIVTHLIFGLPGETEEDMLNSVRFVVNCNGKMVVEPVETTIMSCSGSTNLSCSDSTNLSCSGSANLSCSGLTRTSLPPFGIKITSLYVLKNTRLAQLYEAGQYQPLTKEAYFGILQKALQLMPENCVIHRLTGDPPKRLLIAPSWPADKKRLLNEIRTLILPISHRFILPLDFT